MNNSTALVLIDVLKDIKDELKSTNEKLDKIERSLDQIYGGLP